MKYKEISDKDYWIFQDNTGAYLVLWPNGSQLWYFNGLLHREDGPATEWANGTKFWYIHGEYYGTEEEWQIALEELMTKEIKDLVV